MTTAAPIRMGRMRATPEDPPACQAGDRSHCEGDDNHPAVYRIEKVDPATGEIWRRFMCLRAAGAWAYRFDVPFPPGMWQD
jgi:hypothetical protein